MPPRKRKRIKIIKYGNHYFCPVCNLKYATRTDCRKHIFQKHRKRNRKASNDKRLNLTNKTSRKKRDNKLSKRRKTELCTKCRKFFTKDEFESHSKLQHFYCPVKKNGHFCEKAFVDETLKDKHKRGYHYYCEECDKWFYSEKAENTHIAHHKIQSEGFIPVSKIWQLTGYRYTDDIKVSKTSYEDKRIIQALRHISIQMWAYVTQKIKVVEVEAMYAKETLFIGANQKKSSQKIFDVLNDQSTKNEMLKYEKSGKGKLHTLTHRFAKKIRQRLKTDEEDMQQYKKIMNIIKTGTPKMINANKQSDYREAFDSNSGTIFVVYYEGGTSKCNHIEEKFMKIIEHKSNLFRNKNSNNEVYVAGKMRPCGTCFGKMTFLNKSGYNIKCFRTSRLYLGGSALGTIRRTTTTYN